MADDDDEETGGLFENGHWVWDENTQALLYVSDLPPPRIEAIPVAPKAPTGAVQFRDDIDLFEQSRFKRRFQRKPVHGAVDYVTLQDIKDIAIYTAPTEILSPMLIDLLHLPTIERFHRALIFCCAYYTQVAEEMSLRMLECESKIRTEDCEVLEQEFRDNLSDLRVLVAKEYCLLLIGGADLKKFHHMGTHKKGQSLSGKDARLFETFVIITIQIVFLALGRKHYREIELECQRVFKSEIFNVAEHKNKTRYLESMAPEERNVLLGSCLGIRKKLNTQSPLMNELICHRPIDFRLMGLGAIKYETLPERLQYLYLVVAGLEEELNMLNISVGIIGLKRASFDIMLRPISIPATLGDKSKVSMSSRVQRSQQGGGPSAKSMMKSLQFQRLYPEIVLPKKGPEISSLPSDFPQTSDKIIPVSQTQRMLWLTRLMKLTQPTRNT